MGLRRNVAIRVAIVGAAVIAVLAACAQAGPTEPPASAPPTPVAVIFPQATEAAFAKTAAAIPLDAPRPTAADPRWAGVGMIPRTTRQVYDPFVDTVFSDFVLPAGESYYGGEAALDFLGPDQLARARNEVLARRGYVFTEPRWRDYFAGQPWYKPDPAFQAADLTDEERRYVEAAQERERHGTFVQAGGNVFAADLNQDGREDLVQFEVTEPFRRFTLHVNDQAIDGAGDNLYGYASVIDLDPTDRQLEVMVRSGGPSNDDSFQLFTYDGRTIAAGQPTERTITAIAGDGTFSVEKRARLLQTWFYTSTYKLDQGPNISLVPSTDYPTGNHPVTARRAVPLLASPGGTDVVATIQPGEAAHLVATDDARWVKARTQRSIEGWFEVKPYNDVILDGQPVPAGWVFDGLSSAD